MKKILFWVGGIVGVIVIAALIIYWVNRSSSLDANAIPATAPGTDVTTTSLGPIYHVSTSTTIAIGTLQGTVTVKNFYTTALGSQDEFIVLVQNSSSEITYDTNTSGFYIGIFRGPFAQVQAQAEQQFVSLLGVSQADACRLDVAEGVDASVRPDLAGKPIGLSFCPATP